MSGFGLGVGSGCGFDGSPGVAVLTASCHPHGAASSDRAQAVAEAVAPEVEAWTSRSRDNPQYEGFAEQPYDPKAE
jgi:hypothetical protein